MLVFLNLFKIPGIIDGPQFGKIVPQPWFDEQILYKNNRIVYFKLFFYTDFIWAFLLLLTIKKYIQRKLTHLNPVSIRKGLIILFIILATGAYLTDVYENIEYLSTHQYPGTIVTVKEVLYSLVILFFILVFIRYSLKNRLQILISFIKSSYLSLIILAIIGLALPKAPQVNSIVVNLYNYPINFIFLLTLFAPVYSVIISHYPNYFHIDKNHRNWFMSKMKLWGIGPVYYTYKKGYNKELEQKINFLRRSLGIFFYAALFYMIAFTSETNFNWQVKASSIVFFILLIGFYWLYSLNKRKSKWQQQNKGYLNKQLGEVLSDGNDLYYLNPPASLLSIRRYMKHYSYFLVTTIILHFIFFGMLLAKKENTAYTTPMVIGSLICITFQMITYIYYRTFRSIFRFTFFNQYNAVYYAFDIFKNGRASNINEKKKHFNTFFKNHPFVGKDFLFRLFSRLRFGAFSNNITFLQIVIVLGFINAFFLGIINFNSVLASKINAIIIIISYLFFFYGVIVIFVKHITYYKFSEEPPIATKKRFFYTLAVLSLLVILSATATKKFSNDLFTLKTIDRNLNSEVSLQQFHKNLKKDQPRYYIGSYGGGMKSNAWTMVVLNQFLKEDPDFFNKTVVISGASGGTMGLTNMAAVMLNNTTSNSRSNTIKGISTENILSMDLTHLLGRDAVSDLFIPFFDLKGKDRSSKAMQKYAQLAGTHNEYSLPYRAFWKKLYNTYQNQYPVLIANTTNVTGNQGMAVTVNIEDTSSDAYSLLYQEANNILELNIKDKNSTLRKPATLGYYDAASTSNRFPVISPAAEIETLGHFNDGGIYENSGLLSAYKLFRAINSLDSVSDLNDLNQKNVFINIVNDKNQYIRHYLEENFKKDILTDRVNEKNGIAAILNSVVATEMLPIYVKAELDRLCKQYPDKLKFKTVYLPHRFTLNDVKKIYGQKISTLDTTVLEVKFLSEIDKLIKRNNKDIERIVQDKKGANAPVVEPPMSRVMAPAAYDFMTYMVQEHPIVADTISKIIR
ncbi:hypothetical protein GTQ40_03230 [Flavobacteriaceae bacterium R38]|nr:hypothetical protein [Flavobacteriaceae bacterium R38]